MTLRCDGHADGPIHCGTWQLACLRISYDSATSVTDVHSYAARSSATTVSVISGV
jgi:hypothetical protein